MLLASNFLQSPTEIYRGAIIEELSIRRQSAHFSWGQKTRDKYCYVDLLSWYEIWFAMICIDMNIIFDLSTMIQQFYRQFQLPVSGSTQIDWKAAFNEIQRKVNISSTIVTLLNKTGHGNSTNTSSEGQFHTGCIVSHWLLNRMQSFHHLRKIFKASFTLIK